MLLNPAPHLAPYFEFQRSNPNKNLIKEGYNYGAQYMYAI